MKVVIDIPNEFAEHFAQDRFEDSLRRLSADAHCVAGNYEQETALMLINAFKNSKPLFTTSDLNKIILSTIEWITRYDIIPEMMFYSVSGGIFLTLKLRRGNNHMAHRFYIPGGVLSVENWKRNQCDIELDIFLENAKKYFAIQDQERKR